MFIDKICLPYITMLSICFGRFRDHCQGIIREYKQYSSGCTKCLIKTTRCYG